MLGIDDGGPAIAEMVCQCRLDGNNWYLQWNNNHCSLQFTISEGLPWDLSWKRICLQCRSPLFNYWVRKIRWRRDRLPTLVLGLPLWLSSVQFSWSVVSASLRLQQWTAARQASLSITNSQSPPKPMSIELVMPSNHLILCHPLLLLPSIFPSIRVFSNESALCIRKPKHWSFSFNISPSNEHPGLISFRMDWLDLFAVQVFSNTTVQKHRFFSAQLSSQSNSHIHTWPLEKP